MALKVRFAPEAAIPDGSLLTAADVSRLFGCREHCIFEDHFTVDQRQQVRRCRKLRRRDRQHILGQHRDISSKTGRDPSFALILPFGVSAANGVSHQRGLA